MKKIYTRQGDQGDTQLFNGRRLPKDDLIFEVLGGLDELNAWLGLVRSMTMAQESPHSRRIGENGQHIQLNLFKIGEIIARKGDKMVKSKQGHVKVSPDLEAVEVKKLEQLIDFYQAELPTLKHFLLPDGVPLTAYLHVARTVCRRAERSLARWLRSQKKAGRLNFNALIYLNRLSDLLFVWAYYCNQKAGYEIEKRA